MTANQFRAALDKLGLTQVGAARLFQVSEKTARNWAREGVQGTVVILLRLMLAGRVTVAEIEKINARRATKA